MKKVLGILLVLATIIMPYYHVEAKSYNFEGYYCDQKQPIDDKTFYMTCHIVVNTDFGVNHIEGNLVLKNVTLTDIRTNDDWVNNNGISTHDNFTANTNHQGTFTVADLIYTGNLADTECIAGFEPIIAEEIIPKTYTCAIIDNEYYGKDGSKITEEKFYEDCCDYVCTVVDNKYYFDNNGKSVDYDSFLKSCSTVEFVPDSPQTGIDYGYIILPLGIISIIGIVRYTKKNSKIYKI